MHDAPVPLLLRLAYAARLRIARAFLGADDTLAA